MRTQCKEELLILGLRELAKHYGWLLHNNVGASFDLFRNLLLGDQLKPWELHPLVSTTSSMNLNWL